MDRHLIQKVRASLIEGPETLRIAELLELLGISEHEISKCSEKYGCLESLLFNRLADEPALWCLLFTDPFGAKDYRLLATLIASAELARRYGRRINFSPRFKSPERTDTIT